MADSTLTKQALASALKELMAESSFEKINIYDICEKCHMNRKSFYYHFKDKYDLLNWIFDVEYASAVSSEIYSDRWLLFEKLSEYIYENRTFYRKAFKIKGQNSFSEHFHEYLTPIFQKRLEDITGLHITNSFVINLLSDIFVCAFESWLSEKECMPPDEFVSLIKTMTISISNSICNDK